MKNREQIEAMDLEYDCLNDQGQKINDILNQYLIPKRKKNSIKECIDLTQTENSIQKTLDKSIQVDINLNIPSKIYNSVEVQTESENAARENHEMILENIESNESEKVQEQQVRKFQNQYGIHYTRSQKRRHPDYNAQVSIISEWDLLFEKELFSKRNEEKRKVPCQLKKLRR